MSVDLKNNPKQFLLEADKKLSASMIWEIQRQFFLKYGMRAWQNDIVPHNISCNPYMANSYSQIAIGFLHDCLQSQIAGVKMIDRTQPIYIVELGAGSGRLTHHFIHQFYESHINSALADIPIKFILTDFVPEIIEFWKKHPKLRPIIDDGLLDFAHFDVQDMRPLYLEEAGITLESSHIVNPLIVMANYFFDSIPQDSFRIENGELHTNLLSIYSTQEETDLADPEIWDRLTLDYDSVPLFEPPFENELYNEILELYTEQLPDSTVLSFPHLALDCIGFLQSYANGRLLLLASDRGVTLPESLITTEDPIPNLHGSFSMMVNFHAINQYVWAKQGRAWHTPHYQDNLQTVAYLLGDYYLESDEIDRAYHQAITLAGPDDLYSLIEVIYPRIPELTISQMLSVLRKSIWDSDILIELLPQLEAQIDKIPAVWYDDIYDSLLHVWERYLPLSEQDTLTERLNILIGRMGLALLDDGQ